MENFRKLSIILAVSVIGIVGFSLTASAQSSAVPEWIKNNAMWWSEGSISEADYLSSLEYLITNGIINVPITVYEATAQKTLVTEDERAQFFRVTFHDGLIPGEFTIDSFQKFEAISSTNKDSPLYQFPLYEFGDYPAFLLEGLPTSDKKQFYEGVDKWLTRKGVLQPFDVDIDVVAGDGSTIVTWEYRQCQPTAFGTFLQDVVFYYQYVDQDKAEIHERAIFDCLGIHLTTPDE